MLFKSFFLDNGVGFLNWRWGNKNDILPFSKKKTHQKKKEKKPQDRKLILHRDKLSLIISLNLNHECSPEKFQVFLTFQAFYAEFEMFYTLKMC